MPKQAARSGALTSRSFFLMIAFGLGLALTDARATPFIPLDDNQIVEQLRSRPLERDDIEFRQWRARLRAAPNNLALAAAVAQRAMSIARRDGDPRYLGYAEAALRPWWSLPDPPARVRLLRAIVLQSTHQFPAALQDLATVLRQEPRNAQAWLTQASIFQVQGRYLDAAASCEQLRPLGAMLYADACQAELAGLTGQARDAGVRLERLVAAATQGSSNNDVGWIAIVQAENAERAGDFATAERYFRAALTSSSDSYAKGAYADFLLDRGRNPEVVDLLKNEQRADPLLLRLALAYSALHDQNAGGAIAALAARFDAARLRGDNVHRREEARFRLHLLHQSEAALSLALANWDVQKEPADARILFEAAQAAQQSAAAGAARVFVQSHGWSDQRLATYLR